MGPYGPKWTYMGTWTIWALAGQWMDHMGSYESDWANGQDGPICHMRPHLPLWAHGPHAPSWAHVRK
jgi:hypothetical protein